VRPHNLYEFVQAKPAISPLGTIRLAAFLKNSLGTGREQLRIYGSYALVYLLAGSGHYRDANGYARAVRAGDLIWVFPDLGHEYGPGKDEYWDEFFLVFDGPIFDLWRQGRLLDDRHPVQALQPIELWLERLKSVCKQAVITPLEAAGSLAALQGILADLLMLQEPIAAESWLVEAAAALEIEHGGKLPAIAKNLGLSYETFRKKFKSRYGVSPHQYRQRFLMQKACTLLLNRRLSVKEIAAILGFCDEFHFSRLFKKVTGRPPSALMTGSRADQGDPIKLSRNLSQSR
jgi:AraC-like DNA-binding protein